MYEPALFIALAWLLIYVPHTIGGAIRGRMEGGYDNRNPRAQQAKLTGLGARSVGAHQNGFETFTPFVAGAILASFRGVDPMVANGISVAWILARSGYIGFYLGDIHVARSVMWVLQIVCSFALLGLSAIAG